MSQSHIPGRTTATATREAQDFTASTHVHKLDEEIGSLMAEAASNSSHRAAKTVAKDAALTVTMMALQGGAEVHDHQAHGSAMLHILRGHMKVHLEDGIVDLHAGEAISFASMVPHRLAAVEDSALLLVIAGR